jgi:hypothetical protein
MSLYSALRVFMLRFLMRLKPATIQHENCRRHRLYPDSCQPGFCPCVLDARQGQKQSYGESARVSRWLLNCSLRPYPCCLQSGLDPADRHTLIEALTASKKAAPKCGFFCSFQLIANTRQRTDQARPRRRSASTRRHLRNQNDDRA